MITNVLISPRRNNQTSPEGLFNEMSGALTISTFDRRQFLVNGTASTVIALLLPATNGTAVAAPSKFESLYLGLVGNAKPIEEKIKLELPELAESGHNVRFNVSVESPMSENDYVKAIHILAPENPEPRIASFSLTPLSGKATISGRLRLAKTQEVITLAQLNTDKMYVARTKVIVAVGGCSG